MKLSVSTLACPDWPLEQIARTASACGIEGIDFRGIGPEIDITRLPAFNEGLPDTLALLRHNGLSVPCLNTSVILVTSAPERWQMMLEETRRNARLAERTHTQFIRVFGGAIPKDLSREQAIALAQRHLRQLVKICSTFGCVPLVETHDEWSTGARILELVHEFDPQEIGVLWDVEHPFRAGESPDDTFNSLRRFLRHVHFKDSTEIDGKRLPKLLGEGQIPLTDCHGVLHVNKYDGWIALETEKRWSPEGPDPQDSIPQFAVFMRKLQALSLSGR